MSDPRPSNRYVLARAGLGLAAVTVTSAIELPGKALGATIRLPANVLGAGARGYLQLTHTVNELARQGDAVLGAVFPPKDEQPEWATFDEDLAEKPTAGNKRAKPAKRAKPTAGGKGAGDTKSSGGNRANHEDGADE